MPCTPSSTSRAGHPWDRAEDLFAQLSRIREFYEVRQCSSGEGIGNATIDVAGRTSDARPTLGILSPATRRSTTSPSRTSKQGSAPIICFGSQTTTAGWSGRLATPKLALGWCTYGVGDHMSHYNVNASVSKTLIHHLIGFVATSGDVDELTAQSLFKILVTEISPKLVPADASGVIQSTEKIIGPYELQEFNLEFNLPSSKHPTNSACRHSLRRGTDSCLAGLGGRRCLCPYHTTSSTGHRLSCHYQKRYGWAGK